MEIYLHFRFLCKTENSVIINLKWGILACFYFWWYITRIIIMPVSHIFSFHQQGLQFFIFLCDLVTLLHYDISTCHDGEETLTAVVIFRHFRGAVAVCISSPHPPRWITAQPPSPDKWSSHKDQGQRWFSAGDDTTLYGFCFPFTVAQTCSPTCAPAQTVPPSCYQGGRPRQGGGWRANWKQTWGEVMFGFVRLLVAFQSFFFFFPFFPLPPLPDSFRLSERKFILPTNHRDPKSVLCGLQSGQICWY